MCVCVSSKHSFTLCSDKEEMINLIIRECTKQAQKEDKTTHDWPDKVIHWEMCKKYKFDDTNKCYWHKTRIYPGE